MKIQKPKIITVTKAKKKAWAIFSRYIRLRAANSSGLVQCVSCRAWIVWDIQAQAGHFIPGRGNAILYSEEQVNPQCYRCNIILKGNWPEYYKFMVKKYGAAAVDAMIQNSDKSVQMKAYDHLEIFDKYTKLFKELENGRHHH